MQLVAADTDAVADADGVTTLMSLLLVCDSPYAEVRRVRLHQSSLMVVSETMVRAMVMGVCRFVATGRMENEGTTPLRHVHAPMQEQEQEQVEVRAVLYAPIYTHPCPYPCLLLFCV